MRRTFLAVLAACGLAGVFVGAQAPTPYKLGTFQRQGTTFVGVVIRDAQVINLQVANAAVTNGNRIIAPTDMKDLIARYDTGVRQRIAEIVSAVAIAKTRPAYVSLRFQHPHAAAGRRHRNRQPGGRRLGAPAPRST